ncbi:chorismate mutase [Pantoea sp.]|uniref:chorismate mutase n=1 Tax=Pantoea sp. TaxID=69393 RepID=UPI00290F3CBA|nr:chorismate mutase [Pantoea sp.]MDU4128519.1 chorismate mutase [Pantoea sp.]
MTHFTTILFSSLFVCCNVFAGPVSSVALGTLSTALNERMQVMKEVAGYKAQHHLPIEDLPREQQVMQSMLKNAEQAGLEPHSVEPFVHALMNASKAIQYRYRADWLSAPDSAAVRDLADTRQQIQRLDSQLLNAIGQQLLAGGFPHAERAWLASKLTAANLSEGDKNSLLTSLASIRRSQ